MAVKAKKKTTAVAKKRKTSPAKTKKTATMKKGAKYGCNVCGIVVKVDEICGCVEEHDIICCSKPMKPKRNK
ncbi:MAG: hypothetical protein HY808_05815 [Nitrospirae bacterium]|nr:hypothetical protein [Nitrospirota bacterium]